MRLALIGAFPFPLPQGSQVYFEGQARALAQAGADPLLITYGTRQPAALGLAQRTTPRALSPSALRSGPSLAKPVADAALLATYVRAHRRRPFDVALAHNAEAAVVAIEARRLVGVPVVYVAHTVLRHELSAYAQERWRPALDRLGRAIDTWITRRADGIIALSEHAQALLAPRAACPIAVVPPGLDPSEAPSREAQLRVSRALGLEPGAFVLYAGNLDAYQELELLDDAAGVCRSAGIEIVVATHHHRDGARRFPNLRIVEVASFEEMRALHFAAEALIVTRRRPGGFPVKLLNYMEAARPIVALHPIAPGLEDDRSACLLSAGAGPDELAAAIRGLRADPERARRIGAAGRQHLLHHHAWPELADRTLAFTRKVIERHS
jgi:glycosyltransferase involved in cell wall biosynthesis